MFQSKLFLVGASLSILLAASTHAADSTTTINIPSSAPVKPSAAPTILGGTSEAISNKSFSESMYISLFSNFHGPSVTRAGSAFSLDRKGIESNRGINFDSNLTVAYLFTPSFGAGLEIPFFYLPGKATAFEIGDVGVKVYDKKLVKTQNFSLYGNIILQAITSDYSQSLGQDFAIKTTPNFRYYISGSRFSFGAWTEAKAYLGAKKGKTFKLWAAPHVDYQITPKLSAIFQYAVESDHMANTPGVLNFTAYQTEFNPGIAYFITPHVMINPYLQILATDKIALDRTGIGAIITASL